MPLTIPVAKNYPNQLVAIPSRVLSDPPEGNKTIPVEIDWATMGGPGNCVTLNVQNNAALSFSQIVALSIDNSACGADVEFIFPDTGETTEIPAYAPKTIVELFTNQLQFFVSCPNAASEDITRFSILNFLPPPVAVEVSKEQNFAIESAISLTAVGSTEITAATGTLEAFQINGLLGVGAGDIGAIELIDGNNNVIWQGQFYSLAAASNLPPITMSDLSVRINGGVYLKVTSTNLPAGSTATVNLYYRTP
jgi:hypothetical protein